jgi:hypothetical protein
MEHRRLGGIPASIVPSSRSGKYFGEAGLRISPPLTGLCLAPLGSTAITPYKCTAAVAE